MWEILKLYDKPNPEHLDAGAFFAAFAAFHDINGHRIECIMTRPKYQKLRVTLSGGEMSSGLSGVDAVLFVKLSDMSGMRQGESLKVDGQVYTISAISWPLDGTARIELAGAAG